MAVSSVSAFSPSVKIREEMGPRGWCAAQGSRVRGEIEQQQQHHDRMAAELQSALDQVQDVKVRSLGCHDTTAQHTGREALPCEYLLAPPSLACVCCAAQPPSPPLVTRYPPTPLHRPPRAQKRVEDIEAECSTIELELRGG